MADLNPKAFDGMVLQLEAIALKGNAGEQGAPGLTGAPGKSNYELWLEAGNTGTIEDFLEATKGEKGDDGHSIVSRGMWEPGVYNPGEFVVAAGTATPSSLWFIIGDESIVSGVPPRQEEPGIWSQAPLPAGTPGTKWVISNGPPELSDGDVGDYYLNLDTGDMFGPKTEDSWGGVIGNLKGDDSAVTSVNGEIGDVVITTASIGAATAAQGALAESAIQSTDLAPVAVSGSYNDLANKPVLGTASAQNTDYFVPATALGTTVATLVAGVIPSSQLPSYVDDVLEFSNLAAFPTTGESGKIYIALDTNRQYRWTGSTYVQLIASPGTTDNVVEGSTNLYFTAARAAAAAPVQSVNGSTGAITINNASIGAQPVSNTLTQISEVNVTAGGLALLGAAGTVNTLPYFSTANTVSSTSLTGAGRTLIGAADLNVARVALNAVGTSGDESIAGIKTFTGTNVRIQSGAPAFWLDEVGGQFGMLAVLDADIYQFQVRPSGFVNTIVDMPLRIEMANKVMTTDYLVRPRTTNKDDLGSGTFRYKKLWAMELDIGGTTAQKEASRRSLGLPITASSSAPSNPQTNDIWIDVSTSPMTIKRWDGSAWVT